MNKQLLVKALVLGTSLLTSGCQLIPFEVSWKENYWESLTGPEETAPEKATKVDNAAAPGSEVAASTSNTAEGAAIVEPTPVPAPLGFPTTARTPGMPGQPGSLAPGQQQLPFFNEDEITSEITAADMAAAGGQPSAQNFSSIELMWKVPETPVEGFIINHGEVQGNLTNQVRVTVSQLKIVEEAGFGRVYRYLLQGVPPDRVVYVSISAYTGTQVSPPSAMFEVAP